MREETTRATIDREIVRLSHSVCRNLNFACPLEDAFEVATASERAHRLWFEGLLAIVVLNCCLLADYLLGKSSMLVSIVKQTTVVTPLALVVNWRMRLNPP